MTGTSPLKPATMGEALFCKYAKGPNQRGYCGPDQWTGTSVPEFARQFTGAWAYQAALGKMWDCDPLSEEVVRTYWLGSARGDQVDKTQFFKCLLEQVGDRARSYWSHLYDGSLLPEVNPTHAFHVLGVYPWSRLLYTGLPEPLEVLNNCLLRPATVEIGQTVRAETLVFEPKTGLQLVTKTHRLETDLPVGTSVLLHWGEACDEVTATGANDLRRRLLDQVALTNRRLIPESLWQ